MINKNKSIVWLASYPKSGNTWFRIFLANLLYPEKAPVNINEIEFGTIFSSRFILDKEIGIDSSYLNPNEAENLQYQIFEKEKSNNLPVFHKIHDALTYINNTDLLVPINNTLCAIYFVRNPLDVAVSFAFHSSKSFQHTIKNMSDNNYCLSASTKKYTNQTRQKLLTWSNHVESWVNHSYFPVKVIKYEDAINNTYEVFSSALSFIGLNYSENQIKQAIDLSSFTKLKQQEQNIGFKEKPPKCKSFFRKGKSGDYINYLSKIEINEVILNHNKVMKKFNYLDDCNNSII